MWCSALAVLANFFLVSGVWAATTLDVNPITKRLDLILDVSSIGTITGVGATFTGLNCTSNANGGAITGDASGNLKCSDDDTGGTINSFVTWAIPLGANVVADSSTDTVTFTSTGPLVIFGTAASDTVAWNIQDSGITEVMLKAVDTAADEECLTYETTGGDFEWQSCSGSTTNSFETWSTPSGTAPVADSATDTVTFTASGLVVTGTAGSDTIDFTIDVQYSELTGDVTATNAGVTTIQPNAVALTADTTGNYVASVATANAITGGASGSEGAAISLDLTTSPASAATLVGTGRTLTGGVGISALGDLSADRTVTFDATELAALTWDAGGNASDAWTWNLSANDPTITAGSAAFTLSSGGSNVTLNLGQNTNSGILTWYAELGGTDYTMTMQPGTQTQNIRYVWPVDDGTSGQVLQTDGGGGLSWAAAGTGDITDVYNCASGDCNSIVMADGDLLNGSSVNPNTTTEGIILPQNTTCTANTAEGQMCWDTDSDALRIGDGTTTTTVGTSAVTAFGVTIDGGGSVPTTGTVVGYVEIPYAMTITGWTMVSRDVGTMIVDVWKDTYANYPPTSADSIAGTEKPTLTSANKNQDLSLSTWTTAVTAGDVVAFKIDSVNTITGIVTITIRGNKT